MPVGDGREDCHGCSLIGLSGSFLLLHQLSSVSGVADEMSIEVGSIHKSASSASVFLEDVFTVRLTLNELVSYLTPFMT